MTLAPAPFDLWGLSPEAEAAAREALGLHSVMVVPLVARRRLLGALCLGLSQEGRSYGHAHLAWADELALACAIALDNARLFQDLQAAVGARETLLALVSHDLRGPLNAITISASTLEAPEQATERRRSAKQVELIKRSAHWMSQMLDDLLAAGQVSQGRFSVHPQQQDACVLMREAVEFAMPHAQHKGVRLDCTWPAQSCMVHGDADRLRQVFANLLGNAIKFTPKGGSVCLQAVRRGDEVEFSVADTGPGIPLHQLPHVFESYWTGGSESLAQRKRGGHGLGLGLFIAKGIVEAHHGRIWVSSHEGHGTTLSFTLKVARHASTPDASPREESARGQSER
jgi:signal transduction histidine kinase